jgi:hypothetical protein
VHPYEAMRIVLAVLMIVHGIAHVVGFAGAWGLSKSVPFKTTVLGGHLDLGSIGIRALGLVWLSCALAFAAIGLATIFRAHWWLSAAMLVAFVSLLLCVIELPDAKIGAVLDIVILVLLAVAPRNWWA